MTGRGPAAQRVVAVYAGPAPDLPEDLAAAMLSDVVDLVTTTPAVRAALLTRADRLDAARAAIWPVTPVVELPDGSTVGDLLAGVPGAGAVAVAVVVADAPDLPGLLLGKLFRAVSGRPEVAVCPADPSGLVAVAAGLPLPGWLLDSTAGLDDPDAMSALRQAAPPGRLAVVPGWHRVRSQADTSRLDPGLEGWDATRLVLGG
jgi:hypothetical protein